MSWSLSVSSLVRQDTLVLGLIYFFDQMLNFSFYGGGSWLYFFCFVLLTCTATTQRSPEGGHSPSTMTHEWGAGIDRNSSHWISKKATGRRQELLEEIFFFSKVFVINLRFDQFRFLSEQKSKRGINFNRGGRFVFASGKSSPRTSKFVRSFDKWGGYPGPEVFIHMNSFSHFELLVVSAGLSCCADSDSNAGERKALVADAFTLHCRDAAARRTTPLNAKPAAGSSTCPALRPSSSIMRISFARSLLRTWHFDKPLDEHSSSCDENLWSSVHPPSWS